MAACVSRQLVPQVWGSHGMDVGMAEGGFDDEGRPSFEL